jgi:Ser/Thr protein kinase RdoA (MazF antagonist)
MSRRLLVPRLPRPSRISGHIAARLGAPMIEPRHVREVLACYGLEPTGPVRNLRLGRRNRNVWVNSSRGRVVVKAYRPQWTTSTVRYVHSIQLRLDELGFVAPRPLDTADGCSWTSIAGDVFAVFDFLPGTNYSMCFLRRSDRLRLTRAAGRTLAGLHTTLDGFEPQGEHHMGFVSADGHRRRDLAWHEAKIAELTIRSGELDDRDAAALADSLIRRSGRVLDDIHRLDRELGDAGFRRLIVHGDYGIHNLLFRRDGLAIPVDFELSRLDWRVNDLISAMVKHRYTGGRYDFESMRTFMRAYSAAFPLSDDERGRFAQAWRLYKLQQAVQYWNSYFETDGPARKLASALDSIEQADWVTEHEEAISGLGRAGEVAHDIARTASSG